MKKTQMFIPLVFILLLASTAVPAFAAKEKTVKVEYTLPGRIWYVDTGIGGTMSLIFSGGIKATPDYENRYSWEGPIEEHEYSYYEYEWENETGYWKEEVHSWGDASGQASVSVYEARWYSPQPTFNGKLVAIWDDGSTTTFTVGLSPLWIEKSSAEGTRTVDVTYSWSHVVYWRESKDIPWVPVQEDSGSDSYTWSGTVVSTLSLVKFSGKIQCKGRPPLQGTLDLSDSKHVQDGWEYQLFSVWGQFGPYQLSGGPSIIPV